MNNEVLVDYANKNTRFLNLLIDNVSLWILWILHVFLFEHWIKSITGEGSALNNIIYFMLFYFSYNFIFEFVFGRTIGKLLTGTKVIDYNGGKPNFKTLLIRNLCRLIPFDAVSFLVANRGWHDSISKTYVINK